MQLRGNILVWRLTLLISLLLSSLGFTHRLCTTICRAPKYFINTNQINYWPWILHLQIVKMVVIHSAFKQLKLVPDKFVGGGREVCYQSYKQTFMCSLLRYILKIATIMLEPSLWFHVNKKRHKNVGILVHGWFFEWSST